MMNLIGFGTKILGRLNEQSFQVACGENAEKLFQRTPIYFLSLSKLHEITFYL